MLDKEVWKEFIETHFSNFKVFEKIIFVLELSRGSFSKKSYVSKDGIHFIEFDIQKKNFSEDLFKLGRELNNKNIDELFATIEIKNDGNVKIYYTPIKDSSKLPYDRGLKYFKMKKKLMESVVEIRYGEPYLIVK